MKKNIWLESTSMGTRRHFIKGVGTMGLGSLLATAGASAVAGGSRDDDEGYGAASRYARRLEIHAVGDISDPPMVWPWPPPAGLPPVPEGSVFKVSLDFPWAEREGERPRDILNARVYVVLGLPGSPEVTISRALQRADHIVIGNHAGQGNFFSIYGPIVANPDISPFGDLAGLPSLAFANFDRPASAPNDVTHFTLLGVALAGNHATGVMEASGVLRIKGSWGH